jgi:hypothetical protein
VKLFKKEEKVKRAIVLGLGVCVILASGISAHAWFGSKKVAAPVAETKEKAKPKPAAAAANTAAPEIDKAAEKAFREKWEAAKKKMAQLNNTEWQIDMAPVSGKGKKETEVVTFKDGKVTASNFGKKGFPATNVSLTIQEDGTVIWETMQTSEKAGICFWRGELDKALLTMRGVVSNRIDDKTKFDYSFVSTSRKVLPADK